MQMSTKAVPLWLTYVKKWGRFQVSSFKVQSAETKLHSSHFGKLSEPSS